MDVRLKKGIDTNKFRSPAIHFQKYSTYTFAPPGTSEYLKYWSTEAERCMEGYVAEDGDSITGYYYFYLNYFPINLVKEVEVKDSKGRASKRISKERDFPRFYDYDRFFFDSVEEAEKQGKHLTVLKSRRKGYSYKVASMLDRNFYFYRDSKGFALAAEAEFLVKDGILTKAWDGMDFVDQHTAWYKKRQRMDQKMHKRASFLRKDKSGVQVELGYKSEIMGITLKNDPQKARGKAGKLIIFEEAGKFPNLLQAWQIARPSVEQGSHVFGTLVAFGTGGTEHSDFESLKELFEKPDAYNCLSFENTWEAEAASQKCGFFVPQFANLEGVYDNPGDPDHGKPFMDADGNTDTALAKRYILEERRKVVENATDKRAIDRHIAEQPCSPSEALLNISTNIFPKAELQRHLSYIRNNEKVRNFKQVGELYFDPLGKVAWKQSPLEEMHDIVKYRLDRNDSPVGQVVIWEHPMDEPPFGMYIAGCLVPGEKVPTSEGLMNVEDITLKHLLINKDGEEVGINTLLRYEKVNEPIFKVHMSNVGRPTTYTQEHPLYLSDSVEGNFEFIRVREAKKGMWTKYPNVYNKDRGIDLKIWDKYAQPCIPKTDNPLENPEFWWFVGYWLGRGFNCSQGKNHTVYSSFGNEKEYIDKYKRIVTNLFKSQSGLKLQNGNNTHKFESKQLYLFLEDNFGNRAKGKFISEWVKYIPKDLKKRLVLGYLDSNGRVYKDKRGTVTFFKSINKKLLYDLQDILFSLGIISTFNNSSKAGAYSYIVRLNQTETRKLSKLFSGEPISRKLRKVRETQAYYQDIKNKACRMSEDGKYIYLKIKNIEESTYTGTVYNFDCDTHTFICQYCTGHNCDPYDHDKSGTNSLGSTFIYKRFQVLEKYHDMIVAEYTGRPETANDYYENVRKLLLYYNASLLYENEKKGLFFYFEKNHCTYLLADQPGDLIRDIVKDSTVDRKKGIHMNTAIKDWGEGAVRDWLVEEYEPGKKNLTKIYSEPLLEELIAYNDTGNFDRVMAFMMVMMYRQQLHHVHVKNKKEFASKNILFPEPIFSGEIMQRGMFN